MQSPFIHKFKSKKGNHYIYDVNTNKFILVGEIIYNIINDFLALSKEELISKWKNQYSVRTITSAYQTIMTHYKKGLFSEQRPKQMALQYSWDEIKRILDAEIGHMILNITERCNLRCKYCTHSGTYYYERKHSANSMKKHVLEYALQFYLKHSHKAKHRSISFYGGEPLIEFKKIMKAVIFLSNTKRKINFRLSSNGILLNKNIITFLIKNNFSLQISLDGPRQIQDKYRIDIKGDPTFDRIYKNLKLIKSINSSFYKNNLSFAITITPYADLYKVKKFFESNHLVKEIRININFLNRYDTSFFDNYKNDTNIKQNAQMRSLRKKYMYARIKNQTPDKFEVALFERNFIMLHKRNMDKLGDIIPPNGTCLPGTRRLFVDTNGYFYPCERIGQAYNIGNIDKKFEINKIKEMVDQYINASIDECRNCWAVRLCGLCYGCARVGKSFDSKRKKDYCGIRRVQLHNDFVDYATIMEQNPRAFDFAKNIVIV